jgi:hypothetical protein
VGTPCQTDEFGLHGRVRALRGVEHLEGESPHATPERMHHVVGQVDREAAISEHPDHGVHVLQDVGGGAVRDLMTCDAQV